MTPERWQQVKAVMDSALALQVQERQLYLAEVCGSDASLRGEVESLLGALEAAGRDFLRAPDHRVVEDIFFADVKGIDSRSQPAEMALLPPVAEGDLIGHRLGAYEIVSQIGVGGMGEVYRAVRADDEYRKEVAIKVVRAGYGLHLFLNRLKNERQILATLEHTNISRLLDGGTTENGLPYLVMELIDGKPIDEYCQERNLATPDILNLFLQVCSAVQYAHQHLIIHRDIKPSNILVTKEGIPKLLDFGIAKILDPNAMDQMGATLTSLQALTPIYASPEQIKGEPITTASDIYSLGVILYELLTGRSPYRLVNRTTHEITRAICEQEPLRPSAAALHDETQGEKSDSKAPARVKLSQRIRGDLDTILLMALRKEQQRRYGSVQQFADDVQRHLQNLPVFARQGTLRYRSAKFIARHKAGVSAVLVTAVALVAGLAVSVHEARVARTQQARAERRFNEVRSLANSLLFDLHDAIQDLPGSTPARKLLVERALRYLDSLASETITDPGLSRELAAAYERVGELQGHYLADNLGETSASLASYQKALTIREQLARRVNPEWQDRLDLAESYRRMASQLIAIGKSREALADVQSATALTESMTTRNPNDLKVLYERGFDYEILGKIQGNAFFASFGDLPAALKSYQKCVAIDKKMLELNPNSLSAQRGLAIDTMDMGNTQADLGRQAEALNSYQQALQVVLSISQQSKAVKDRRRVAVVYNQIASLYERAGNWTLSSESHQKGLDIYQEIVAEDPKNTLLRQGLAIAYVNSGDTESKLGHSAKGRAEIKQGLAIMQAIVEADPNSEQRGILAQMYMSLADNFERSDQWSEALREYRNALQIFEAMHPAKTSVPALLQMATCRLGIGEAERRSGALDQATADLKEALALATPHLNSSSDEAFRAAAGAYAALGDVEAAKAARSLPAERQNHWTTAIQWYQQSLTLSKQAPLSAQADARGFHATEVARRLQKARSEMGADSKHSSRKTSTNKPAN